MNIIGQTKLLSKIDMYYAMRFLPKTLMLLGPTGCGKRTIAKYISEKFGLDFVEIEDSVSAQDLEDYTHKTIDTLYLINLNKFTEKQQNQFLRWAEEPSKSVYILFITNSEAGILNTILNRSFKYHLEPYTKQEVEQITGTTVNEKAFTIFKTPGKLINMTDSSFNNIINLADNVVKNIHRASYANALVISTKINYKDLYNKVDFNLFFDAVEYLALEDFKANGTQRSLSIFNITNKFKQYATQQNLLKETLMLNYLTTLWEAVNYDISRT
jgi:replication-associated recombination protein RarA